MPTSSPTDAPKHLQPHTCGREEQVSSTAGLITAEQLGLGQGSRGQLGSQHAHAGDHPQRTPCWMGCRPKAHTFLETGDLLRSGTSLVTFLTEFILQNPQPGSESGCSG